MEEIWKRLETSELPKRHRNCSQSHYFCYNIYSLHQKIWLKYLAQNYNSLNWKDLSIEFIGSNEHKNNYDIIQNQSKGTAYIKFFRPILHWKNPLGNLDTAYLVTLKKALIPRTKTNSITNNSLPNLGFRN